MKNITIPLIMSAALLGILPAHGQKQSPTKRPAVEAKEMMATRVEPYFLSARKKFDAGNLAGCAGELTKASNKIYLLASESSLLAAEGLHTSVDDLEELAQLVTAGELLDGVSLDRTFALAHRRMAKFHNLTAEALLADKKNVAAGRAMKRTADHIEHATKWSGEQLGEPQNAVVEGLRSAAGGLVGGTGTVVEGTGTVLKKSLGLITTLGEKIKGEAKPATGNLGQDAVEGTRKVTGGAVKGAGKVGEAGAGAVEKTGGGLKKVGDKVSGEKE